MHFPDRTFESIMRELLASAPPGIDLRQGGIFYDAVASAALKLAQFYTDLNNVFDLVFITTAVGEYLDRRGREFNVWRNPATRAQYDFEWRGPIAPQVGDVFFHEGLYFTLRRDLRVSPALFLEANEPGAASNNVSPNTAAIPLVSGNRLEVSKFASLLVPGSNEESDDNYRRRIIEKIAGPAESGNRQNFKTWVESNPDVGRARILPLFAGANTVAAVVIDHEGRPAAQSIIDSVQKYIDPVTTGLVTDINADGFGIERPARDSEGNIISVGSGLGDGAAAIGVHFAAIAPSVVEINISLDAELTPDATEVQAIENIKAAMADYIKDVNLNNPEGTPLIFRVSVISAILHGQNDLIDYSNLTLNDGGGNILLNERQVGALGRVTLNAITQ